MTTPLESTVLATPAGPLTLIAHDDALVAAGFSDLEALRARLPVSLGALPVREVADLGGLSKAVLAYLDGDLAAIDDVPVRQQGTALQERVWEALRAIPPGETVTYAVMAARVGAPAATRAIGSACGRNLVAPVVPCHRVVRTRGGLGGYAYGLPVKEWLLAHERASA